MGAIIGRGGENLKKLSQEFQVTVDTRKQNDGPTLMVVIGRAWGVEQAVERIGKIQQDAVLSLKVSKETFVFVERSPALRQQCQLVRGVSMTLVKLPDGTMEIRLRGAEEGIKATQVFLEVLASNLQAVETTMDRSALPALIGRQGSNIRQLESDTGSMFIIEQANGSRGSRGGRGARATA